MWRDDETFDETGELVDLLIRVLDEAPPQPPAGRVAALRAQAEAAQEAAQEAVQEQVGPPHRWPSWLTAAAVGLGLLAGLGAVAHFLDTDRDRPAASGDVEYDGTLTGPAGEPADAALTVVRTGIGRVVELDTRVLPILPAGEFYEVWFVGPVGEGRQAPRISAGTFHPDPDGRSHVRLAAAVDPARYPEVEITAEPGDGDPARAGPVVLRTRIGG